MAGIKIPVGTDNTGLTAGVAAAQKKLTSFKGYAISTFAAIGAASGLKAMFTGIAEKMDRIGKVARGGLGVEFLQKLYRGSELAGTSFESSVKAIRMFVKEIRSADGPTAEIAAMLRALGLSLEDLEKLDAEQLFVTISSSIGNLADETDQTAAVTGLLGTRYADLLPLIQDIAHRGLPDMATASADTIDEIQDMNDSLTILGDEMSTRFAPLLSFIAKLLRSFLAYLGLVGEGWGTVMSLVIGTAGRLKQVLEGVFELDRNKIRTALDGAREELAYFVADVKKTIGEGITDIKAPWQDRPTVQTTGDGQLGPVTDPDDVIGDEGRAAIEAYNSQARDRQQARVDAREQSFIDQATPLAERYKELRESMQDRQAAFNDPASITASSMRRIGGGGGVAAPNEERILRVNEQQLAEMKALRQAVIALGLKTGVSVPFN
ncbi:hypothetical protein QEH52_01795 [Coraliomargarita sp. SDUM461003]|uniref:Phage tail tape measure protein domain-containing protein n=1 Tax=Thalassobacterium maritimum TaxID=3041265 RepID=A0ABU1ASV4_9BACT|nr:hypothetical protein [Coraliomargarita sp. SDUM461003]MDQ8206225.1 hypothetical protein [Coraliomargarita sp. SDUM461003]